MQHKGHLGVLTSGGDAPGMNAAVRAVIRTALEKGLQPYTIQDGYRGLIRGRPMIKKRRWQDAGGILWKGGTDFGSARSEEFKTEKGQRAAARNLLAYGLDRLVVVGGDGSLEGALVLWQNWAKLRRQLVNAHKVDKSTARRHTSLHVVGLPASIDNDLLGTDISIGADTALHRITAAIDALNSTAASHQRSFVVEVMGRNCGYLALMSGLATGADWVLIPENPPDVAHWEDRMCEELKLGREEGRRGSIVVVAEGARNRNGRRISSRYVQELLEQRLGWETRVTVLGHVQRGGSPTAFDRNLGTLLGYEAVQQLLRAEPGLEPQLIGMRGNRVRCHPLAECIRRTKELNEAIRTKEFAQAMRLRGVHFQRAFETLITLVRTKPSRPKKGKKQHRFGVLTAGANAPGMNAAVRAAVRAAMDRGHRVWGVETGFQGLVKGRIREMQWMTVNGWAAYGGSELKTSRFQPQGGPEDQFEAIAQRLEETDIDGLILVGGWTVYQTAREIHRRRDKYAGLAELSLVCLPANIDNNLPGAELSVGADTAVNSIVDAVDKIKQSAAAARRCFVVDVMGRHCGYLAFMSALATGAEKVYLHELGLTQDELLRDRQRLWAGFKKGKRLGLLVRNEKVHEEYDAHYISRLMQGAGNFDARFSILGHLQQGGAPTPFDRILATELAVRAVKVLERCVDSEQAASRCVGLRGERIRETSLMAALRVMDERFLRAKRQWWRELGETERLLAQPIEGYDGRGSRRRE